MDDHVLFIEEMIDRMVLVQSYFFGDSWSERHRDRCMSRQAMAKDTERIRLLSAAGKRKM